jgi:hypothetical protein
MIPNTLDLALNYLAFNPGRYLFPIKAGAKFPPLIQDNLAQASNDPEQIKAWYKKWPGCNWGLSLRKSNLMVADVDTKPGKVGQVTYDLLDLEYGWPETETVGTPSGGKHCYYDGPHVFALGEHGFGKDIDSPNYVLIAGDVFKDGTSYKTIPPARASVPAPQWFYDIIGQAKKRVADAGETVVDLDKPDMIKWATDYLQNDAAPSIEGRGGEHQTLKVAMSLRDNGISEATAVELMNNYYNVPGLCEPEWEIDDLTKKVNNAYTYANLSKQGGKTAEADFVDDDAEAVAATIRPKGDVQKAAREARARRVERRLEAAKSEDEKERVWTLADIVREWVWVANVERFINRGNLDMMWKTTAFNATFKYLAKKGKLADLLFSKPRGTIPRCHTMVYLPGRKDEFLDAGTKYNLFRCSEVEPAEGDTAMWREHLEYLFPNERDRDLVLNWIAWLLQNLGYKPKHALLIQGHRQGTGKSFIAEVLQLILGKHNVATLSQNDLHGDFNGWALRAKLIWIEELRALDRTEVKNKLHPLVTQERIRVNDKNVSAYAIENCFGIFCMTNDDAAISLDNSDRRYLVIRTDAIPRDKLDAGDNYDPSYYGRLYALLDNPVAIAAIAHELMTRDVGAYDGRGSAPETEAKVAMIESGMSDLETWMIENAGNYPLNGRLITVQDVMTALPKRLDHSPRLAQAISSILKHRFQARPAGQHRLSTGGRVRFIAINGTGLMNIEGWEAQAAGIYETDRAKAATGEKDDSSAADDFGEQA